MDQGLALAFAAVAIFAAGAAVAAVAYFLRRGLPEPLWRDAAALAAAIRAQAGAVVTEERIKLLAGVAYDTFAIGSQYVGREEFCALIWELVQNSLDMDEAAAVAAALLPVDVAGVQVPPRPAPDSYVAGRW